jgi:hypothetical protein
VKGTICDRCGKPTGHESRLTITLGKPTAKHEVEFDLCEPCDAQVHKAIATRVIIRHSNPATFVWPTEYEFVPPVCEGQTTIDEHIEAAAPKGKGATDA